MRTAHESLAKETDDIIPGTYVQNKASRTETREIVLSIPTEKNFERSPRAPECTDRAETSTNVSGGASPVRVLSALPKSARTKRKSWQKYEKLTSTRKHIRVSVPPLFLEEEEKKRWGTPEKPTKKKHYVTFVLRYPAQQPRQKRWLHAKAYASFPFFSSQQIRHTRASRFPASPPIFCPLKPIPTFAITNSGAE